MAPPPVLATSAPPASDNAVVEDEGATSETGAAPILIRAIAGLLDIALVLVALGVFIGVFRALGGSVSPDFEGVRALVFAFFGILAFYWILYLRYIGETAGMNWMGLHIVGFNGHPPDEGQRWARALGTILSTAAIGLGFVWAAADEDRLTWHDRLSRTFVTRARPASERTTSPTRRRRPKRSAIMKAAHRA